MKVDRIETCGCMQIAHIRCGCAHNWCSSYVSNIYGWADEGP